MLAEALQERAEGYQQRSQAAVESLESSAGKAAASQTDVESEPLAPSLNPRPCGHFVSADYEADCARFLTQAKSLARRRAEAGLVPRLLAL